MKAWIWSGSGIALLSAAIPLLIVWDGWEFWTSAGGDRSEVSKLVASYVEPPTPDRSSCAISPEASTYQFVRSHLMLDQSDNGGEVNGFADLYALHFGEPEVERERNNLDEWYERFCGNVLKIDIAALLYNDTYNLLRELEGIVNNPKSQVRDLPPQLYRNSFARHLVRYRCREFSRYLVYCKRVEPLVSRPAPGVSRPAPSLTEMQQLLEAGYSAWKDSESQYVRLRYAYQVIRLAHYMKEYDRVIELYDEMIPATPADPSILFYWIEGHRAGALQKKGQYAESAYLYSRVFDQCPSKRESAYRSFKIQTDEQWQQALLFCQNEHERATMYVLRAQNPRANLVEEMRSIFRIQPDSRALEPLLVREVERLEADFLGLSFNPYRQENLRYGLPRPIAQERMLELQDFVREVVDAGTAARPQLWMLAQGYLELLAGDLYSARESFAAVEKQPLPDSLAVQLNIFEEVLDVMELSAVTDSVERYYYTLINQVEIDEQIPDFRKLVFHKFRAVYLLDGRRAKALLMRFDLEEFKYNLDLSLINELLLLADTEETSFDRRLLAERAGPYAVDDLNDMLSTYHLQRGQLLLAADIFNRIPPERHDEYGKFYPFQPQFHDRVHVEVSDTALYNKSTFFDRMAELEDQARRSPDPEQSARAYFTLGLGYYNMSYFSYNWRMADYFRSGRSGHMLLSGNYSDLVFPTRESRFDNYENMGMERALYYFDQARRMAQNPEAAAQATYYAAKCERNMNYTQGRSGEARSFGYFDMLRSLYRETNYYQRVVDECKTFEWYVSQ